jgi:hypothetical protein
MDQPKTPWAPSFSVTVQGLTDGHQVEVEPLTRRDVEDAITHNVNTDHSEVSHIGESMRTVTQPVERSTDLTIEVSELAEQSTSFNLDADTNSTDLALQEITPVVEQTEKTPK